MFGVAFTCGFSSLVAQRAHQFEFGAFGSFTRYDKVFNLDSQIGGGGRLGYFFSNVVSAEVDAGYQSPNPKTGSASPTLAHGSASLVLNFGTARNLFYILGGYSRLDFEQTAPYRFTDDAIHGAIGDRIFLGDRAALRFEVRGFYTPNTGFAGGDWAGHVVGSLGLSVFTRSGPAPDQDHDGVVDRRDACPDTPIGATVDARGCPSDADHDAVFDGLDKCADTPAGATVDPTGCPTDTDKDGVYDGIDQCAGTPAGTRVDANGCPPVTQDSDRDGVPNDRDKCPGTPAGTAVDQNGCMVLFREERAAPAPGVPTPGAPAPRPTLILQGVHFQTGRSVLTLDSYVVLDQVAGSLVANPEIRIEIAGYTDSTGSAPLNVRLSQARAASVRAYLARKGVSPERMVAKGYGASGFIAPNTTAPGRAQNRRVELHKLP